MKSTVIIIHHLQFVPVDVQMFCSQKKCLYSAMLKIHGGSFMQVIRNKDGGVPLMFVIRWGF